MTATATLTATQVATLTPRERRHYEAALAAPKIAVTAARLAGLLEEGVRETVTHGGLEIVRPDHGGARIYYRGTDLVLGVDGRWTDTGAIDWTSEDYLADEGRGSVTWADVEAGIRAALATL